MERGKLKMKKRKWLASVLLTMVATMSLSIPAFAGEPETRTAEDSTIPSTYVGYISGFNTDIREKDNYSYHYIRNDSGFSLCVLSKSYSDRVNRTQNGRAIVPSGEYFIANYVKESGKNECFLNITSAYSGLSGFASGAWSPDSVGSYPVVN